MSSAESILTRTVMQNEQVLTITPVNSRPSLIPINPRQIQSRSAIQTRAAFDPENDPDDREFARSVQEHGVIQPILVYRIDEEREIEPVYGLIAGHRRMDAALYNGLTSIPAFLVPVGTSPQDRDLLTALENLQRKDLRLIEKANQIQLLMQTYGYSQRDVSIFIGLSESHVSHLISLLQVPTEIQQAINAGQLSIRSGWEMGKMDALAVDRIFELHRHGIDLKIAYEEVAHSYKKIGEREEVEDNLREKQVKNQRLEPMISEKVPGSAHLAGISPAPKSQPADVHDPVEHLLRKQSFSFRQAFKKDALARQVPERHALLLAVIWLVTNQDLSSALSIYKSMTQAARSELVKALLSIDRLSVLYAHSNYAWTPDSLLLYLNTAVEALFGK
jgi:ParB/RepB/Spo0J family partition protein